MDEVGRKKTTQWLCVSVRLTVCALALALAATGCSTFSSDWKKAAATAPTANDISGRWEGSWLSDVNGHRGKLRCHVTRFDDTHYRTRYKATYWKILRIGYKVNIQVKQESPGVFRFRGETDLGWWGGGVYHYDGKVTPTNFFSTYQSKYDHGTFQMTRP